MTYTLSQHLLLLWAQFESDVIILKFLSIMQYIQYFIYFINIYIKKNRTPSVFMLYNSFVVSWRELLASKLQMRLFFIEEHF